MDTVAAVCSLPDIDHQRGILGRIAIDAQMDQMNSTKKIRHQERSRVSSLSQSVSCSPAGKSRGESMNSPISNDDNIRFYQSDSVAGGVPILELIRMLEDEMHISRDDKLALNAALLDSERRDIVIITLRDIELSSNIRFTVRRLKMLIHRNPAGMPADVRSSFPPSFDQGQRLSISTSNLVTPLSSNSPATNKSSPSTERFSATNRSNGFKPESFSPISTDTKGNTPHSQISPVVRRGSISKKRQGSYYEPLEGMWSEGPSPRTTSDAMVATSPFATDSPVYSDPNRTSMCSKIRRRLVEYNGEEGSAQKRMRPTKFAVLVGSGSCNPLTRMHMRSFFLAKQHLERIVGFVVLGSILSPSHGVSVRERYRNHPGEVIPSPHRLAVAQLMVAGSKWLSVDPWEITRRRTMDYLSLLQHCRAILSEEFPAEEIKIIYLCKENMVPKISPSALRQENFGCISVCR
jgi:Cytidylyltransferase-like